MPSGFTANTTNYVIPSVGILKRDVSGTATVIGLTRGGTRVTVTKEYYNLEFDNKRTNIELLDKIVNHSCTISGTLIEFPNDLWTEEIMEPGATEATAGTPSTVTVTPAAASSNLASGDYLTNLDLSFKRGDGKDVIYRLPKALCIRYEIVSQDPSGAEVAFEFESRLANATAASNTDTAPYEILIVG